MPGPLLAVVALLGCALPVALSAWWVRHRAWTRLVAVLLLAALGAVLLVAALAPDASARTRGEDVVVLVLTALLAVCGGGPLTTAVFGLVDQSDQDARSGPRDRGPVRRAAEVLRGGAWIGAFERVAIHAALVAGWPEGLALTLALKGLGRYPELRHQDRPGIAERFLIGTFVSVLWATACAGAALLLRR